jgi:hypothetical protein
VQKALKLKVCQNFNKYLKCKLLGGLGMAFFALNAATQ